MGDSVLRRALSSVLGGRQKRAVKSRISEVQKLLVRLFRSYDARMLTASLRSAGITESDTVMFHSNFAPDGGFRGAPLDLVNAVAATPHRE